MNWSFRCIMPGNAITHRVTAVAANQSRVICAFNRRRWFFYPFRRGVAIYVCMCVYICARTRVHISDALSCVGEYAEIFRSDRMSAIPTARCDSNDNDNQWNFSRAAFYTWIRPTRRNELEQQSTSNFIFGRVSEISTFFPALVNGFHPKIEIQSLPYDFLLVLHVAFH